MDQSTAQYTYRNCLAMENPAMKLAVHSFCPEVNARAGLEPHCALQLQCGWYYLKMLSQDVKEMCNNDISDDIN